MWNEILERFGGRTTRKLTWRRIATDGGLLAALMATASWLVR